MVRFEIGIVQLEKMKMLVDSLTQLQLLDQLLHSPHPAIEHAMVTIGKLVLNIARIEHRSEILRQRFFVQTCPNFSLASSQLFCYFLFHSKCLLTS